MDLNEIESVWAAAAPGPWEVVRHDQECGSINYQVYCGNGASLDRLDRYDCPIYNTDDYGVYRSRETSCAIAKAPEHIGWLAGAVRDLETERDELRVKLGRLEREIAAVRGEG